jgi:hypothetical protein
MKGLFRVAKNTKNRVVLQRFALFLLVGVLAFTIVQPAETVKLYLAQNPILPGAKSISPLTTASLSSAAKPLPADPNYQPLGLESQNNKADRKRAGEIVENRTAYTKSYRNTDGTKTIEYTPYEQNYKEDGKWKSIDNSLDKVGNSTSLKGSAGQIDTTFKPLSDGITIEAEGKTITIKPLGVRNISPTPRNDSSVVYKDAWPNVDIEYELRGQVL